ncbi:MAG: NADH-quinone oxidoreductase subunit C [Coxiellaceae bacterium]|nr:NADH-quinone oxidoreductase subunit C [Coxiellaceae bacterium]
MSDSQTLATAIQEKLGSSIQNVVVKDMVTVEVSPENLLAVCMNLRDHAPFNCEELVDICGVDYLDYGYADWRTEETTATGFSRGVDQSKRKQIIPWDKPRFGVVYHLLSLSNNHRVRLKVYLPGEPLIPSVIDIWASANWYEREAFDLFGIYFDGHPDLRRLLTDYGFKGHPFRKDFPLIGEVEMRYDAAQARCVYEPVSIVPRTLVPKVIRDDNRYLFKEDETV